MHLQKITIIETKHKIESVVQVVRTMELVCIAHGNIEQYNHDKLYSSSSKIKHRIAI